MKFAAAGLSLIAIAAHAQERVWIGQQHDGEASLVYGTPDSGDLALSFSCSAESGDVTFSLVFEPINATDGVKVEVTLQAGDIILPVRTTGTRQEMDNIFVLEGEMKPDARLTDLLTSDGVLEVFVEDGSEEIPLDGAREAAQALLETCPLEP